MRENHCHHGDALTVLRTLPDESAQMCVTSPPYWGLRDYGVDGQLGLESTPEEYVGRMVAVFAEVRRVLRQDGTLWLNVGDSYAAKDLCGIPWRLAFALQANGWYLRQDIIWHKPNPMPESVTDRCTSAHEYLFLLSRSPRYYYDADSIREAAEYGRREQPANTFARRGTAKSNSVRVSGSTQGADPDAGRNRRSVWTIASQPYPDAHFATFPRTLVEPCIMAGSKAGDVVLDPFMGSGTTAQVAQDLGRKWTGIELNGEYLELQHRRTAQTALVL